MFGRPPALTSHALLAALKAAAEPTRLRILMLLASGELNVSDLTTILGQSQPRISRHLKLLAGAGLIERFRQGSWLYVHLSDRTEAGRLVRRLLEQVGDDSVRRKDLARAEALKREREAAAQAYFDAHAAEWDSIRALHVAEAEVEAAILDALGPGPFKLFVDLGTGTGRILELFGDAFERGLGIDLNRGMLAYARGKLAKAGLARADVRHGDIYAIPLADGAADAVVVHQVLHYLTNPAAAIAEAARVLAPGGRLLIVDFAPHDLEFLRDEHAHERLGFPSELVQDWIRAAGLKPLDTHALAPAAHGGGKLTVSLWLAERERVARTKPKARSLEDAQ